MTHAERTELARLALAFDTLGHALSVRALPPVTRPLAVASVQLVLSMDRGTHACGVCGMVRRHRCSCPFSTLAKWVRQQERQAA